VNQDSTQERRFISDMGEGETLDQVFLAVDKQLRSNRNGNLYLQVRLADRTGTLMAMLWNANERVGNSFEKGDYVRVKGSTQVYNGGLQMIANEVQRVATEDIADPSIFVVLDQRRIEELLAQLTTLLRSVNNYHLRNLAECFLIDEDLMQSLQQAPAGIRNHHAYRGGLLEHVVSLMLLCEQVTPLYPGIDSELLRLGAFMHDIGKVEELIFDRELGYSDEGQAVGHMVQGVSILDTKIREAEKLSEAAFPHDLAWRLRHMIVSHHGRPEYGAVKVPMTLEAVTLHFLDSLDAKINSYTQWVREDANSDSPWTNYSPQEGRKFYKPSVVEES
jgi:3'-5' exoribonuclease